MTDNSSLKVIIEREIRSAFAGVRLGDGTSLRQAAVIDNFGEGVTEEEFRRLPESEVTDSWEGVPWSELESDNVAHLDPEGWRYYLPAFMLSLFEHYDPASMRVIGTLSSLYPKSNLQTYHLPRYNLLSLEQKEVVARYLQALPKVIELDYEDQKLVERAIRNYWGQFLPMTPSVLIATR